MREQGSVEERIGFVKESAGSIKATPENQRPNETLMFHMSNANLSTGYII